MIENPNPFTVKRRDVVFVPVINALCRVLLSEGYRNMVKRFISRGIVAEFYQGDRVYPNP